MQVKRSVAELRTIDIVSRTIDGPIQMFGMSRGCRIEMNEVAIYAGRQANRACSQPG